MNNKLLIVGMGLILSVFTIYYLQSSQKINELNSQLQNISSIEIQKAYNQKPSDSTILFDGCGELNNYTEEAWYLALTGEINTVVSNAALSENQSEDYPITDKFVSENSTVCYSANKNIAILLFKTRYYMEESEIYRFDISQGELQKPVLKNETYLVGIEDFDKVQGNIFYLESDFGDAGVAGTHYYHYDVLSNTITLVKTYFQETISNDPYLVSGEWIYY